MNKLNIEAGARITELCKQRGYTHEKLSELADVSAQFLFYRQSTNNLPKYS